MRFLTAHCVIVLQVITACSQERPRHDLERLYDAFVPSEALWCREYEYIAVDAGVSPYRMCEYRRADSVAHAAWDARGVLVYLTGGWPADSSIRDATLRFRQTIDALLGTGVRREDPDHPEQELFEWIAPGMEVELVYVPRDQRVQLGARVISDSAQ